MAKLTTKFNQVVYKFLFLSILICIPTIIFANELDQKIVEISGSFLNAPYQFDPLGEGKYGEFNQEPLYRFDKFDCETYVDTVLSLAMSFDVFEFEKNMMNMRYQYSRARFVERNHFPSADWIPNNIRKNYISYLFIPNFIYSELNAVIDKKSFYQNMEFSRIKIAHLTPRQKALKLKQLRAYSNSVNNVPVRLYYIPLHSVPSVIHHFPDGCIIMIVKPTKVVLISHMGFGIWKGNDLYFRSASSIKNKVKDVNLLHYLDYQSKLSNIIGIAVFTANSI
jgi:hypothetical protein